MHGPRILSLSEKSGLARCPTIAYNFFANSGAWAKTPLLFFIAFCAMFLVAEGRGIQIR